nr:hypothetical protein BaRGS_007663 [Batillaria attramentaria]
MFWDDRRSAGSHGSATRPGKKWRREDWSNKNGTKQRPTNRNSEQRPDTPFSQRKSRKSYEQTSERTSTPSLTRQKMQPAKEISRPCTPPPDSSAGDAAIQIDPRDKEGRLLTTIEDQLTRWTEHFQEVLNRPPPDERPQLEPGDPLDINTGAITKAEIRKALSSLKNGKAAGTDNIPAEALKEGGNDIIDQLHHLLILIWTTEEMPTEWKKGLLVKLPKHGNLSQCCKWKGITLLSIPSKVLTRVILDRMKDVLDKTLRDEQAGFRKERSCTDQIANLRVIVEQSIEWQSPLYVCFIESRRLLTAWIDKQSGTSFSTTAYHQSSLTSSDDSTRGSPARSSDDFEISGVKQG